MGTQLLEVDNALLSRFAGGEANFTSYKGPAYQIEDERNRYIALTPPQAHRVALAIIQDMNPDYAKLDADEVMQQAFPTDNDRQGGMTLRDYFAAKFIDSCRAITNNVADAARAAYQFADAMLLARKQVS